MFNNREIKRLEDKAESLQSLINDVYNNTTKSLPAKYTFKTGKK
jgi:hypothetical protein